MATKVKFPIRTKLLLLMAGVVVFAISAYLALAIKLFKDDKTSLVYELNASTVRTLAAEVDAELLKTMDKVRLLVQGHQNTEWVNTLLENEPNLIAFSLYNYSETTGNWEKTVSLKRPDYLKLYNLGVGEIDNIRTKIPIPFTKVLTVHPFVINSTLPQGAPILTIATPYTIRGNKFPAIAVADLRLDRILELVNQKGIATVYLVDIDGTVIAHPDPAKVQNHTSLKDIPIVQSAIKGQVGLEMKRFDWDDGKWLGAYAKVNTGDLRVISQVKDKEAFKAASQLMAKSALFALIILTITIFITSRISKSFTEPLYRLLGATEKISKWEFGGSIQVKTNDEIANLAHAFNSMSIDLRTQREQIDKHQAELEQKVRERTAALEEQKRKASEAQDALLRTTRLASLGELAGIAAHEVLNPVNNINVRIEKMRSQSTGSEKEDILLFCDIVKGWKNTYAAGGWNALETELKKEVESKTPNSKRTLLDEDLENLVALANDAEKRTSEKGGDFQFLSEEINRITKIINNMRSLARVGGERHPIKITTPIDDTIIAMNDIMEKSHVKVKKEFASHSEVIADKDELIQVFSNILKNAMHAIKSSGKQTGEITVRTKNSKDKIEIRISDNGTGIKKEHVSKIFEPDFTTKSLSEGTGLGLSISKRLVRAFAGDIEVEKTVEGQGTTFLIWFPLADAGDRLKV